MSASVLHFMAAVILLIVANFGLMIVGAHAGDSEVDRQKYRGVSSFVLVMSVLMQIAAFCLVAA